MNIVSMNTVSTNDFKNVPHPCKYCGKNCFGLQCKDCHLKMISEREGKCNDCGKTFPAMRKDGTMRFRCSPCQEVYKNTYIAKCSDCENLYNTKRKDGLFFDKCYSCYRKKFTKCKECESSTLIEYPLCKTCYVSNKTKKTSNSSHKKFEERKCNSIGCDTMTTYFYCMPCNINFREISDSYMISR